MKRTSFAAVCAVVASGLFAAAPAQEGSENTYRPLFTPEMIRSASPAQAQRMRATEERNRKAWDERQAKRREAENASARRAESQASGAPPAQRKRKIYRWVDKDGRVHFGDAPPGRGAEEVTVRGVARVKGNPPPAPGLGERDR